MYTIKIWRAGVENQIFIIYWDFGSIKCVKKIVIIDCTVSQFEKFNYVKLLVIIYEI